MANLENIGEVIRADLLIAGGGLAGLCAAIKAKEEDPDLDVLLVDKQSIGWGGMSNKGGGIHLAFPEEYDLDKFVEYHTKNLGYYLNDQELLYAMARDTVPALKKLEEWGVSIQKNEDGSFDVGSVDFGWALAGLDHDLMLKLRKTARKLKTRMMDKIQVVEFLKNDDRITGAVGFNLVDGKYIIFKTKAIILANGDCQFKGMRMWRGSGDGINAAYMVGAEMRNAEFGNFYEMLRPDNNEPMPFAHHFLYNSEGEFITPKYMPQETSDIPASILLGMEKEVLEGKGPICLDMKQYFEHMAQFIGKWERPHVAAFYGKGMQKAMKYGPKTDARVEIIPGFIGEFAPVKVDHEMKTTVPGLWAIGDTSRAGSAWTGALPPPGGMRGSGLMNASVNALHGTPSAVAFAKTAPQPEIDVEEVKRLKEKIFAPMGRDRGYETNEAIYAIQDLVAPIKYNLRRNKERMEEALKKVMEVKDRFPDLYAKDGHELCKCHEAKCLAICAEMGFRAALMRTESRGWHYREDFPEQDDKNWLKWVIVKQDGDEMKLSTEPVPIERYKVKP